MSGIKFSNTTPPAPVGRQLITFQTDGQGNISATIPAGGGGGGVSSVAMTGDGVIFNATVPGSPITTVGTLAPSLLTQAANKVLAGPTSGGAVAPTFRLLVAADVPNLPASIITTGQLALARGGTNADLSATGGASQVLKQVSVGAAVTVGQLAASDLSNGVTGSGAIVLATSPTLVTPTIGVATATSLTVGLEQLQSDTGRYGTSAIRVQALGTNSPGVLTLMPSGSSTESDIRMYNTSDPANVGAVELNLVGTTLSFLTENFGTGNKPTTIDLSGFVTEKAASVITSSLQLQLQETGDTFGTVNLYLRNRTGQNGAIFENKGVCLTDFGFQTSAVITNIAINGSNVLTVTAAFASGGSSLPAVGQQVNLSGLTTATFLNGQSVFISTVSATQFTATFSHALYASAPDTGTATCQLNIRSEFRNDHVMSTANTSGELQFFVVGAANPYLVSGTSNTVIGDSISTSLVADFNRALMLIATNAVMNVTRISASMTAAAPAFELAHATSSAATPDYFWDIFGNNAASLETLSIRRRTPEFSGIGSDAIIATFDQNGGVSVPAGTLTVTNNDSGRMPATITGKAFSANTNVAMGSGTGKGYAVIGAIRGSSDVVGDRAYAGWFFATAQNQTSTEVALHAETADAGTSTIAEFYSGGTQKAIIDGGGNLTTVGTIISPQIIAGSISSSSFVFECNASHAGDAIAKFRNTSATGFGVKFVPGTNGNYGIAVGNAADTLNVFSVDGNGFVTASNAINATVGFTQNGTAGSGHVLRGNGSDFVDAALAAADLSNGVTGSGAVVLATAPTITSLAMTGKITTYNNIATVGNGVPGEVASVALTLQSAAKATTTLYAVPASGAGQYRISWNAKVTRAATTSSTLGALTISYTDPDGVVITTTMPGTGANPSTGIGETVSLNTTSAVLFGFPLTLNCKASTNITYAFAYVSSGATTMQYNLNILLEAH